MSLQASTTAPHTLAFLQQWKQELAREREQAQQRFLARPSPASLLRTLSAIVDRHVRAVWRSCDMDSRLALVAVGGYGRGQLFPNSDVDILVLLSAPAAPELCRRLEQFIGALWDMGLEVGHSVRTIAECVDLAQHDITVQTTLLEARLVAGQRSLLNRFREQTARALDPVAFVEAKMLEQQQRHARFEETSLEPNVKESDGGLRDLQNILWIAQAGGIGASWRELTAAGLICAAEATAIRREERFLQTLRARLHYLAGRREDRLL
ncbi:MAG TPA: nucleotidyltransferase domain-containing protein, partial [Burkholderiales bacterium]